MITIIPAIDLKNGKCVRLRQGLADEVTEYSDDPVAMALHWQELGGEYLHVVDLDGAFEGAPRHSEVLRQITAALDIPVEIGGGLRSDADIAEVLAAGVDRAILGTRACEHPEQLAALVGRFGGERLAVGIDARDGMVQTKGWVETTSVRAVDLASQVASAGVATIIYTDTSRDGMMVGVNAGQMDAICAVVDCDVVASGGVSAVEDVRRLKALARGNLVGAIVGKALYDKSVSLEEMQAAARD
jgi:phosphoribosylformimino-5-aminoimidazole carboxamide ribotide isomerase